MVNSCVRTGPDVMEERECGDVDLSFHWQLTKEEVESCNGGGVAQFEETSECLLVKNFKSFDVGGSNRQGRKT